MNYERMPNVHPVRPDPKVEERVRSNIYGVEVHATPKPEIPVQTVVSSGVFKALGYVIAAEILIAAVVVALWQAFN